MRPDIPTNIELAQRRQSAPKGNRRVREFAVGDEVWVKTFRDKEPMEGKVVEKRGLLSYLVEINGKQERRHVDQLRKKALDFEGEICSRKPRTPVLGSPAELMVPCHKQ
ncbi:Hypothetical protein NTJ_12372 [Nesidiocoris tenuis]|nr:Hypothetical protein NTJ_12372 [Nesidiocoris tenuis]